MGQNHNIKKSKKGKHFNWEERIRMETLDRTLFPGKKKPNFSELGKRLGRSRSSVSREYHKGKVMNKNSQLEEFVVYSARKGQDIAKKAALNKGPQGKLTNKIADAISEKILKEKLSPYAALKKLSKTGQYKWLPSERTVYYAINAGLMSVSRSNLPYKPPDKRLKKASRRMAYNNVNARYINERSEGGNNRTEYGHWEMDTVVGGKGTSPACLLVMTERKSRHEIIRKISGKTQEAVVRALARLEREKSIIFKTMKSITTDNGGEFLDTEGIEYSPIIKQKRCDHFFAHPYSSYERGSNEVANRVLRRFIPKGTDISKYTKTQIQEIENWMNSLPRKILDGLSAEEKIQTYFKENAA